MSDTYHRRYESAYLKLQYLVGLGGFLYPKLSSRQRAALSPLHMYLGRATFVLGLSTMAVNALSTAGVMLSFASTKESLPAPLAMI